jgi:hypothetical protein
MGAGDLHHLSEVQAFLHANELFGLGERTQLAVAEAEVFAALGTSL